MKSFTIGVDGGGTKTTFSLIDVESKSLIATAKTECTNHNSVGTDKAKTELVAGIRDVRLFV